MKVYKCSKIGEYHTNHNEDDLIQTQIGEDKIVLAVMDGCSMGTDSHFASTLLKKIIRKTSSEIYYKEFIQRTSLQINEILHLLLEAIFKDLALIKNILNLNKEEILTTLVLAAIHTKFKSCEVIVIGDGIVNANGNLFEFDQNNKPDYIGYHINENFETWINSQTQTLTIDNIEDLSISTDGIHSFKKYHLGKFDNIEEQDIINLLLNDKREVINSKMLTNKIDYIEKEYGLRNYDDISIMRIIFN